MAKTKQEKLYALLDLLEEYRDEIDYGKKWNKFDRVVSSQKSALINYDKAEGEFIKIFKSFRRAIISAGVSSILAATSSTKKSLEKGMSYDQYQQWQEELGKRIPQIERDFQNKLIVPITATYGDGFERGMEDQGIKPRNDWMYLPGHAVPRLTNLRLVNYISANLTIDMTAVIVEGMRAGKNGRDIGRDIRSLLNAPKEVVVAPKLDPITGEILRQGFSYNIPINRYAELIGRTEVNRATNLGRLDSYRQSKLVKSVQFITAGDDRVCEDCESLSGTIESVDKSFSLIPVHPMCRCTWIAYEYYSDDREAAAENFVADEVEQAINTAPLGVQNTEFILGAMNYANHLEARGFGPEEYPKVYMKLKQQLRNYVKVPDLVGWDRKNIEHLYALHLIKNNRLYTARMCQEGLKASVYEYAAKKASKIPGNTVLADTTWLAKDGIHHTRIFESCINQNVKDFSKTVTHEIGHNIHSAMKNEAQLREWTMLHNAGDGYVTNYATTDAKEDFAESFAYYIHRSEALKAVSPAKFSYMSRNIFES